MRSRDVILEELAAAVGVLHATEALDVERLDPVSDMLTGLGVGARTFAVEDDEVPIGGLLIPRPAAQLLAGRTMQVDARDLMGLDDPAVVELAAAVSVVVQRLRAQAVAQLPGELAKATRPGLSARRRASARWQTPEGVR